jgi:hypothetical protein
MSHGEWLEYDPYVVAELAGQTLGMARVTVYNPAGGVIWPRLGGSPAV